MNTDHRPSSSGTGRSLRRWRAVALVAIGLAVGVAMTATPVVGHITESVSHLWNKHIKPKTDARYYKKAQADTRFLGSDEKAADAELLDGLDSTEVVQGNGEAMGAAVAVPLGSDETVLDIPGAVELRYLCPEGSEAEGTLVVANGDAEVVNLFVESGQDNPTYNPLAPASAVTAGAAATGDSFHIQAQGSWGVLTIEVATVHRATECYAQAQAVLTR
jgi:hypothetical protein